MARCKGMGSIRERNGKFSLRFRINGKEKPIKLKATNRADAEKESLKYISISQAKTQEELTLFVGRSKNLLKKENSPNIEDVFKLFLESPYRKDCSQKTLDQHEFYWHIFLSWLNKSFPQIIKPYEIDYSIANDFFIHVFSLYKSKSYNYVVCTMQYIYRIIDVESNPFLKIEKKYFEPSPKKEFTQTQLYNILDAFEDVRLNVMYKKQMQIVFYLGAYTGMRFKDCVHFLIDQANFKTNRVKCRPYKTRKKAKEKYVHVKMHPDLREHLLMAQAYQSEEHFLPDLVRRYEYNEKGSNKDANRIIDWGLCDCEDLKNFHKKEIPHNSKYTFGSLRHSFVSFCADAGIPLEHVAAIVGHTCISMTRYYTHIQDESLNRVVDALPSRQK